jgi:allatostatin C receptor
MKACLCARGKDLNAQLQVENSIFPKFGRSRGSEKLTSIAKHKTNGGLRESEAVVIASEKDKKTKNSNNNNICVKTTNSMTTIPAVAACNNASSPENNKKINGFETTNSRSQRTPVLHTDL